MSLVLGICACAGSDDDAVQEVDVGADASHPVDAPRDDPATDAPLDVVDEPDAPADGFHFVCSTTNCGGSRLCCEGFVCIDSLCCAPKGWPCDFSDAGTLCCSGCNATGKCL